MRHSAVPLLLALLLGAVAPRPAVAVTCAEAIAGKFAAFTQTRMKLMQRCRELVLMHRIPGPCPDYKTASLIEKARTKLRQVVNQRCGGEDETCGAGGDDVPLGDVGWNMAQCPDLHGAGCTQTISHCGDVADCLVCVGEAGVDAAMALVYDALTTNPPLTEVARCQTTIGRSVARYFNATSGALAVCEQRDLDDEVAGTCPDSRKTAPRLARAEEKLVNRICSACGSTDQICGGDDLPPDWIGFPTTCPNVTPPGRASCAHSINQLTDVIDCVHCVTDFELRCLDPLAVPTLKSYPASCP